MDEAKARAVAGWLIDGARSAMDSGAVLGELCERLVEGGLPLARVGVFVRTLHPQLMGRSFVWQPGAEVQTNLAPADVRPLRGISREPHRPGLSHAAAPPPASRRSAMPDGFLDPDPVSCRGDDGLFRHPAVLHRRRRPWRDLDHAAPRRLHGGGYRRHRDHPGTPGPGRGGARAAPHRRQSARHLCRPSRGRAHPRRQDPSRRYRTDRGRHLALRHARLHRAGGPHGARKPDRPAERLFRLPGARHQSRRAARC